jgi:HSP20 family molecular chaperone IbpA
MNLLTKKEAPSTANRVVTPHYNVRETSDAYVLTASVPGVDKTSLETTVDGETLTILGRRAFQVPADWTPVHREIPQADFKLVLEVDRRFNRDAIKAELSQGVLTLTLPKAEAVKPRKIEILG